MNFKKIKTESITLAYAIQPISVLLAGFAPALSVSLADRKAHRYWAASIALLVIGKFKKPYRVCAVALRYIAFLLLYDFQCQLPCEQTNQELE